LGLETIKFLCLGHFVEQGYVLFIPGHPRFIARRAHVLIRFHQRRPYAKAAPHKQDRSGALAQLPHMVQPRPRTASFANFPRPGFAPWLIDALAGPVRNVHWLSIGSGDVLSTKPDLAGTVYDLLNEAVDSGFLSDGLGGDPRWLREDAEP
jgi:hypothetical protein